MVDKNSNFYRIGSQRALAVGVFTATERILLCMTGSSMSRNAVVVSEIIEKMHLCFIFLGNGARWLEQRVRLLAHW